MRSALRAVPCPSDPWGQSHQGRPRGPLLAPATQRGQDNLTLTGPASGFRCSQDGGRGHMGRPVPPRHPAVCYRKHRPAAGTRGAAPRGPGIAAVFLLRLHGRPSRGCEELLEARVWGTRQVTWDSGSHLPSRCLSMFMTGQDLPQAWGQPPSPDPQPGRHTEPLLTRTSQTHTLTGARTRVHTEMHMPRHTCVLTHVYARTRAHPHPAGLLAGLQSRAWPTGRGQKTLGHSSQSRVCTTLCC